ncbi:peptide chain release factor N(5)-glutamine methyltransferase [Chitinimonas sp. BJB300]|uniref:peptide chain release factor N(5)-glutamine methyltransferase n=1 Tax=Chitinimonas sp. BJB300 TaxID=1559339 RepID=UPI000C122696|nr:peptide chain release factor N(5)-glutamine methyltransferase [Chitinimonas sp. BJB300]PHV12508.1 protein-(glutamine-N5) methyltransferase, release factor-specific [Chitinimonas sp. BJB300]TSJ91142.1 peptide chain release factor N(5)-glutamine methyltransferase [Chitinimonas sp. BJB300]
MKHTVASLISQARQCGLPSLEARLLLEHVSAISRTRQAAWPEAEVSATTAERFQVLTNRRAAGEPVAYLVGTREFFSLELEVSPAVLIPRPETELLVELALERLPLDQPRRALDLGTGSGAIPVSLRKHRPQLAMYAIDISNDALEVAARNAERHSTPILFARSNWYTELADERFDLIISNPPYIAAGDAHLNEGDLRFEPAGALSDGADGMLHIRQIVAGAATHLRPGGWLLFEHGYDQAETSRHLLNQAGFQAVCSWRDLAGIERVSGGRLP